jgi:hypothetical protein
MFQSLRRAMLLPRVNALRGVEVSFRDWLLDAAGLRGRLLRWTVCGVVGMLVACGWLIGLAIVEVTEWFEYSFSKIEIQDHISGDQWNDSNLAWGVAGLLLVLVPVVIYPLLARRAARRVLMQRHECPRCRHDVRGTPLNGDHKLTCTECGYVLLARSQWSEVQLTGERATFQPAFDVVKPLLSRRALRGFAIAGGVLLVLGVLIPPAYWGLREYRIRAWAKQAGRAPRYTDHIESLISGAYPSNPPDAHQASSTFWQEMMALRRKIEDVQRLVRDRDSPAAARLNDTFYPEVSQVADSLSNTLTPERRALLIAEHESARRMFDMLAKAGIFDRIDRLFSLPLHPVPNFAGFTSTGGFELSAIRNVIQLNRARAAEALRSNDTEATIRAWRSSLEIAHRIAAYPTAWAKLSAASSRSVVLAQIRASLREQRNPGFLDACAKMIRELCVDPPLQPTIALERADMQEFIVDFYAREGIRDRETNLSGVDGRIGSFDEASKAVDTFFADVTRYAALPTWSPDPKQRRGDGAFETSADTGLAFVKMCSVIELAVGEYGVMAELEREATLAMLAIERYRGREGKCPNAMTDLVPADIPAVPVDPWSGKPLMYRVLDENEAVMAASVWPYLLYSVGPDRADDGGVSDRRGNPLLFNIPPGTDNVITVIPD